MKVARPQNARLANSLPCGDVARCWTGSGEQAKMSLVRWTKTRLTRPFKTMNADWFRDKPDTLNYHLQHPEVDRETHAASKRAQLAAEVVTQFRVYFDTKYWVYLRDVFMGRPGCPAHQTLFDEVSSLRATGKLICPVGYSVFSELLRQSDPITRLATASVIDSLADGVCIQPPHELVRIEVSHFIARNSQQRLQHMGTSPIEDVWTKAAYILGDSYPTTDVFPSETLLAMQKAFEDFHWATTLRDLVAELPFRGNEEVQRLSSLADELTRGKFGHAHECRDFSELFLSEISGMMDHFQSLFGEIVVNFFRDKGGTGTVRQEDVDAAGRLYANLIYSAFKAKRISVELPSLHIQAGLHAALRNDRIRRYKPNDFEDFHHASTALPYFNLFCTEKSLRHLLCTRPLEFDKAYGITVLDDADEIVDFIHSRSN